jgi:hypothetical protein
MGLRIVLSSSTIVMAFSFSAFVGVLFGYLPARIGRAAESDRGVALRMRDQARPRAQRHKLQKIKSFHSHTSVTLSGA